MRHLVFFTLILFAEVHTVLYAADTIRVQDVLVRAWLTYTSNPSSRNAKVIYQILSSEDFHGPVKSKAFEGGLSVLAREIEKSHRDAVKVAFRLYSVSDGHFGEELAIMLGTLIRRNPTLFLQEFKIHRDIVTRVDALVGNLGPQFVDQLDAQRKEIHRRITALRSVQDSSLAGVQAECIEQLEDR